MHRLVGPVIDKPCRALGGFGGADEAGDQVAWLNVEVLDCDWGCFVFCREPLRPGPVTGADAAKEIVRDRRPNAACSSS